MRTVKPLAKKIRRPVWALIALGLLLSLSGCFDRRELDELGLVLGGAIDVAEEEGTVSLTLQMARISSEDAGGKEGSKGNGGGSEKYLNISGTGESINFIVRDFEHKASRRIYMPYMEVLIFGEDLAKKGVRDSLDFFARSREARMITLVAVAKGKAADILDVKPMLDQYPAAALAKQIHNQDLTSDTPIVTEFEFVRSMVRKTTATIAPLVRLEEEEGKQNIILCGSAVFKGDIMVGELDLLETKGMLWARGDARQGILNVQIEGSKAAVEFNAGKSKLDFVGKEGDRLRYRLKIGGSIQLGDQKGETNLVGPENFHKLRQEAEQAVREIVLQALTATQEMNADVFALGDLIYRKQPQLWSQLAPDWDEWLQKVDLEIEVKLSVSGSGRVREPLKLD